MGFAIYINSRSIVEGWDIELGFNSFVAEKKSKSLSTKSFSSAKTISLIILLLLLNIFQPAQVYAEEWYQNNSEEAPVEILDEVLSSEDFGNSYTRKWIRFKDFNRDDSSSGFNFDEANIKEIIGFILRAMLVLIIAAGLIFIGYRLFKTKGNLFSNQSVPWQKGIIPRFAEKENVESLLNAARKLFDEGQIRKAWAACLSAVLGIYANQGNVNFALNDTESDCLIKINHTLLWGKEDAALLILRWIKLAYAGIEPLPEQFNDALSFCEELKNKLSHLGDADE
jgi:hypothetical protein